MSGFVVSAFYKFVNLEELPHLRQKLLKAGNEQHMIGSILLASEGINGTIAGKAPQLGAFMEKLRALPLLGDLEEKRSHSREAPFLRFKVRLKREIVSIGIPGADPRLRVGTYVDPTRWKALVEDPETLLIDTRNSYEVSMGRFKGAVDPHTRSFREFPEWARQHLPKDRDRKIAMYCTGGIRCEKATSLLKGMGYHNVYHLKGGILNYLEKVPAAESLWEGSCFVFDQRVGLEHGLREDDSVLCHGCRNPVTPEEQRDLRYEPGVSCPHCAGSVSEARKARLRERQFQVELALKRGKRHLGRNPAAGKDAP